VDCAHFQLKRVLEKIAMPPFVSLVSRHSLRIAAVILSTIAAAPVLAQSAAQWPERATRLR
jgi:hypothetical protein